jgi:hypothetical protein
MISAFKPQRGRNRKFRPQQKIAPSFHTPRVAQPQMRITPPTQDVKGAPRLRIMALGGLEEVGRNKGATFLNGKTSPGSFTSLLLKQWASPCRTL